MEQVILVDEKDTEIGTMEKIEAHEKALLHRAFSVFVFNDQGKLLLQQRAMDKYHSPGLWTNTCCSHPRPGETIPAAAHRRLKEEMGFDTELTKAFDFIYHAPFSNGLTEHEFDHVMIGYYNQPAQPNSLEVQAVASYTLDEINEQMQENPSAFTIWFLIAFPKVKAWWEAQQLSS